MTNTTQAAKRAAELIAAEPYGPWPAEERMRGALVKLIQQVSAINEMAVDYLDRGKIPPASYIASLRKFILPHDVDPLRLALDAAHGKTLGKPDTNSGREEFVSAIRAELASRGLCIAPIKGDA